MSLIPKKIYQSWKSKDLSPEAKANVDKLKAMNPEYEHVLFDDADCRKFLLDNFGGVYAQAFDSVLPGAFKCDFWRYAMLYVHGGVYLDIDMVPLVPLKELIGEKDELVSIVDIKHNENTPCGIYQAFIACRPQHPVLLYAFQLSFSNIATRRNEEYDSLSITGPIVMGIAYNLFWNNSNTHASIMPGVYDQGIVLYKMDREYSYDLDNNKIFSNRFEGYDRGPVDYTKAKRYFVDSPPKKRNYALIIAIAIIAILLIIMYKRKVAVSL
jgi:hypothetical protein